MWGQKVLEASTHSISSPKPTSRRKKCQGTNEGDPDCQNVLPRTTLSSAGQNHGRGRRHVVRGNPLEDRKRDSKPYGLAIGAWWRSNPRRRVTSILNTNSWHANTINVNVTPGQCDGGHSSSQSARKNGRWDVHSRMGMDD